MNQDQIQEQAKRGVDWKLDLLNLLAHKMAPRVITPAQILEMAKTLRPGTSAVTARTVVDGFEHIGALRAVNSGLYLNRRAMPPAEPPEAAQFVRSGAYVSLHRVLGQVGAHNNPTQIITAVVPLAPGQRLNLGPVPVARKPGEEPPPWGVKFHFYGLDQRFFPKSPRDSLVVERGARCPTFTPEAALLQWIHLAKQHRSSLTRPPHGDIEFLPEGDSLANVGLHRHQFIELASRWKMTEDAMEWLAQHDAMHSDEDDYTSLGTPVANPSAVSRRPRP